MNWQSFMRVMGYSLGVTPPRYEKEARETGPAGTGTVVVHPCGDQGIVTAVSPGSPDVVLVYFGAGEHAWCETDGLEIADDQSWRPE